MKLSKKKQPSGRWNNEAAGFVRWESNYTARFGR